eukprot:UN04892
MLFIFCSFLCLYAHLFNSEYYRFELNDLNIYIINFYCY